MKDRIPELFNSAFYYLSGAAMFLLCLVMLIEVVFRYIPGLSMAQPWIPGVLSLLDTWLIFLASVVAMKKDSHLRITFFTDRLPPRLREWNTLFINIITLVVFLAIIIYSREIVATGMDINFGGVPFSKGYSFIALPVCLGFMTIVIIFRILESVNKMMRGNTDA